MSVKIKAQCFINSATGVTVYLSAPMVLHELITALGESSTNEAGKELFPSMAINLPNTLNSLRAVKELATKLASGKHILNVEFDEESEPMFYDTVNGNRQMSIPGIIVDLTTVTPFVGRIVVPEAADQSEATEEEQAQLTANQKRLDEQKAKRLANAQL